MKKNIFIILIILTQSCQKEMIDVTIDNPTNKKIEFYIDEQKIIIDSTTEIKYKISKGVHKLKMHDKTQEFSIKFVGDKTPLINPTESIYVLSETIYQLEGEKIDLKILNNTRLHFNNRKRATKIKKMLLVDTINIAGIELIGLYKKKNEIVIQEDWDYGVNEKVPKKIKEQYISVSTNDSRKFENLINGYPGRIKLYRAVDLLIELKEEYIKTNANKTYK